MKAVNQAASECKGTVGAFGGGDFASASIS